MATHSPTPPVTPLTETTSSQKAPRSEQSALDFFFWHVIVIIPLCVILFLVCVHISFRVQCRDVSHGDHGSTLAEFIYQASNSEYEIVACFGGDGTKYFEDTQKDGNTVVCPSELFPVFQFLSFDSFIIAHTHPLDYPFSLSDLRCIDNTAREPHRLMVISPDHIYTLEAPDGWPSQDEVIAYTDAVMLDVVNGVAEVQALFVVEGEGSSSGLVSTNQFLYQFAEKFNLIYKVISIEEWSSLN